MTATTYKTLRSVADLEAFQASAAAEQSQYQYRVLVCSTGCRALGAVELSEAFRRAVATAGLEKKVQVVEVGCHGQCARAPLVLIEPVDFLYGPVKPEDVPEIVETTLLHGRPVERLGEKTDGQMAVTMGDVPFYRRQRREVFRTCGRLDPRRIDDAVAHGTYAALGKALATMTSEQVIEEITGAGLRGGCHTPGIPGNTESRLRP